MDQSIDSFIPKCIKAVIIGAVLLLIFGVVYSYAAEVNLAWDPVTPAPDGYRIFQRLGSGAPYDYTKPAWEGTETTCTISDLLPGNTYFFVVRAFVNDVESGDSNEVNFIGSVPIPANLRISLEIGIYIDDNGKPSILISGVQNQ